MTGVTHIDAARRRVTALAGHARGRVRRAALGGRARALQPGRHRHAGDRRRDRDRHPRLGQRAAELLGDAARAAGSSTAAASVVEIDETQPELLRAAQVSLGLLGVMTSLEIEVVPAYRLAERIEHWPLSDVLERWDELFAGAPALLVLLAAERGTRPRSTGSPRPPGQRMTDTCYVKVYDEAGDDVAGRRDARTAGSTAATASTPPSSSPTSTSSSTSSRASAGARRSRRCAS